MSEEVTPAPPPEQEAYAQALAAYESARVVLEECLRALHRKGQYPSPVPAVRFNLPDERTGVVYRAKIGAGKESLKFYITPGCYPDGRVGEIFVVAEKEGSYVSGLLDAFATVVSIALQYGVPLEKLTKKLMFTRFEPSGFTRHSGVGQATSVIDFIMRWLAFRFEPQIMEGYTREGGQP